MRGVHDWRHSAVEAVLDGRGLTRLAHLAALTGLVRLALARNRLASAAGLGACPALEELDLSCNCIVHIGMTRIGFMVR